VGQDPPAMQPDLTLTQTFPLRLPAREGGRVRLLNWYEEVPPVPPSTTPTKAPVNPAGWSVRAEVRSHRHGVVVVWEGPALEMDGFGISLAYTAEDAQKIETAGLCTWDLRLSRPYLNDVRPLAGTCSISPWTTLDP
jgi:hypothetical protein